MKIQENVSLKNYSTMRLGGNARYFAAVESEDELMTALTFADEHDIPFHILGGGSNSIFQDDGFSGIVIAVRIKGISTEAIGDELSLAVGAGEIWDEIVALSVEKGYADIAGLSLIPGSVGAAPVQNIGAYGQQISDVIVSVRAYDTTTSSFVEILRQDCNFTYRHSRFNTTDAKHFIITFVKMRFRRKNITPPFYADVSRYFSEHSIDESDVTPLQLRDAVSAVRTKKLPNPQEVANTGSFFGNPVISPEQFQELSQKFPELKSHHTDDGNLKLYAGQLIELCGFKDFHDQQTGMATWRNQALVLVNESASSTKDLLDFKQKIVHDVAQKFNVTLVQEPELVDSGVK
jgi:UDP-N-acetylmuramate dehydrogenase